MFHVERRSPLVEFSTLDLTDRDVERVDHALALAELEAAVLAVVLRELRAVTRRALAAALPGLVAAGTPDLDALSAITADWQAAVEGPIQVALAEVYGAATLAQLTAEHAGDAVQAMTFDVPAVVDERAAEYLSTATNRLVGVGDEVWNQVRAGLVDAIGAGESIETMAASIETILDDGEVRAITVARTETVGAANAGTLGGARLAADYGGAGKKQWLATIDYRTRESHAEADGQTVALDEPFLVGGETLDYPGDPAGSAGEVVNCRCTMLIVDDEDETDLSDRQMLDEHTPAWWAPPDVAASGTLAATDQEATMGRNRAERRAAIKGARSTSGSTVGAGEPIVRMRGGVVEVMPRAPLSITADGEITEVVVDEAADVERIETQPEFRPATPKKESERVVDPTAGAARPETWHSVLVVEGVPTGDKRLIDEGALTWRDLPLPIMWQTEQPEMGGHAHSVHVAQITRIERQGAEIHSWGYHLTERGDDGEQTDGERWYAALTEAGRHGISVDMDDADVEIVWPEPEEADEDEDPMLMLFAEPDVVRFTRARLMGATDVPFPAFSEAYIEPIAAEPVAEPTEDDAVVAAALLDRVAPPFTAFTNPSLPGPMPFTVADDGRVFGHLATWGTCHTSFQGACITPPHEDSHDYYAHKEVVTDGGDRVVVGTITMGTGHAATRGLSANEAAAHYDHTGTGVADVSIGNDEHGIWISGVLRPGVSPEQVRVLRASSLSGDWRRIGGQLRLVAVLAVNVPGFPIPRTQTSITDGVQASLVAAGIVPPQARGRRFADRRDYSALADRIARSIGRDRRARADELRARITQEG